MPNTSNTLIKPRPYLSDTEFPAAFVRHFSPVRFGRSRRGLVDYVLDSLELSLYCTYATGEPIPSEAIWSIIADENGGRVLQAGEVSDAEGYIVTERPARGDLATHWNLPRRLTYRQKLSQRILEQLLDEIRSQAIEATQEFEELIRNKLNTIECGL